MKTPAQLGFRMPAEWEPHEATWLAWPHNATDWPGKLSTIVWVYADLVRKLATSEEVRILVNSRLHEGRALRILLRAGADMSQVRFFRHRTNRAWTRDYGPLFVKRRRGRPAMAIARFRFNGWARYDTWQYDDAVPLKVARNLDVPLFIATVAGRDMVLEGGSIDVNGRGALLTTEECLLDRKRQPRNPHLSRREIEQGLHDYLGATHILWLRQGITGDDTHGHIDDFCRFVAPETVVICQENNSRDANYKALHENWERLQGVRLPHGRKLEIVPLPMPSPVYFSGMRLPASYANFLIGNRVVLVPTFNDARDTVALGILAEVFPRRKVLGVHALDLVWGLGGIHCITMQQPVSAD